MKEKANSILCKYIELVDQDISEINLDIYTKKKKLCAGANTNITNSNLIGYNRIRTGADNYNYIISNVINVM